MQKDVDIEQDQVIKDNEIDQNLINHSSLEKDLNSISQDQSKEMLSEEILSENVFESKINNGNEENILENSNEIKHFNQDKIILDEDFNVAEKKELASELNSETNFQEEPIISESLKEENDEKIKQTVRKLSLFDTLENSENISEDSQTSSPLKSEPVFHQDISEIPEDNIEETNVDEEFSGGENDIDEDLNQEVEEELLDIPTFLRRQAN
tara:strand:- start:694 stop:1326 length:633 start_codon:yes stop_codon:yes gene_type:complete